METGASRMNNKAIRLTLGRAFTTSTTLFANWQGCTRIKVAAGANNTILLRRSGNRNAYLPSQIEKDDTATFLLYEPALWHDGQIVLFSQCVLSK
jgi:hypothetical protein